MSEFARSLTLAIIISLVGFIGSFVVIKNKNISEKFIRYLQAFAGGFIFSAIFLSLTPAIYEEPGVVYIIVGSFILMLFLDYFLGFKYSIEKIISPIKKSEAWRTLVILTFYAFLGGSLIFSSYYLSPILGLIIFLILVLEKFLDGISIARVMEASGRDKFGVISASSILGFATISSSLGFLNFFLSPATLIAIGSGVFLKLSFLNFIIPTIKIKNIALILAIIVGALVYLFLYFLLGA